MPFITEPEPPRGVALDVLPGIRRVVAANPSVMTYHGTNTYLVTAADGLTVIDPGPEDPAHVRDVLAAAGDRPIRRIVLTHTHKDHYGAVPALAAATGAPVHGYRESARAGFTPDVPLDDGDETAGLTAIYTPGHAADHLCFQYFLPDGTKILFSGDHVMSWSSSIVSPPDGDMLAYYTSLKRLLARDDVIYLGGHGPLLENPRVLAAELLAHRVYREGAILEEMRSQIWSVFDLAAKLYDKVDPYLKIAAQRNVLAHLLKLRDEGIATEHEPDTTIEIGSLAPPPGVQAESGSQESMMRRDAQRRFGLQRIAV